MKTYLILTAVSTKYTISITNGEKYDANQGPLAVHFANLRIKIVANKICVKNIAQEI